MDTQLNQTDLARVRSLYKKLLESWNNNNASEFALLFSKDGNTIGFDGSQMNGQQDIYDQLSAIFANHKVASYVGIVRDIRPLSDTNFVLRADAGMVPSGKSDINPVVNAIQTLIAQKNSDEFSIAVFQNTPAAFHGRPELSEKLTEELRRALKSEQIISA